jgi:KUP system potassium uptake protein
LGICKTALVLNYFGQAAYLLQHEGETLQGIGGKMEIHFTLLCLTGFNRNKATSCCSNVSQALISGSFTLINEAMRLNFGQKSN